MMLGKRGRPPMKRTTSMTEFTLELNGGVDQHFLASAAAAAPRVQRRNSGDFAQTASFLRACSFCKRHLIPGRDIFMYRGDTAFCSLECRQQQITHDERKDKCSLMASKNESSSTAAAGPKVSGAGETVPAV